MSNMITTNYPPQSVCPACAFSYGPRVHSADCPVRLEEIKLSHSARHHDVLCLVLRELTVDRYDAPMHTPDLITDRVRIARRYADLAYPPPKDEP